MRAVRPLVPKVIEQRDDVPPAGVMRIGRDDFLQQLDLVLSRLGVVRGRLDDLERDVPMQLRISSEPDLRDQPALRPLMSARSRSDLQRQSRLDVVRRTPAELAHDLVPTIRIRVARQDLVIAAW